jgi:hypothetical protein
MKAFAIAAAGLLATGGLIVAELHPLLRVVDINLTLQLSKTSWGGGGRIWFASALMLAATMLWTLQARRWPAFLSGAALGVVGDICFSAWRWRSDQLELAQALGFGMANPIVQWQIGGIGFAAAIVCIVVFFIRSAYPVRAPKLRTAAERAEAAMIAAEARV